MATKKSKVDDDLMFMEAKDAAAEKIDSEDEAIELDEEEESETLGTVELVAELQGLLDGWDDTEHEYYTDLSALVEKYAIDEDPGEEEEYVEETW